MYLKKLLPLLAFLFLFGCKGKRTDPVSTSAPTSESSGLAFHSLDFSNSRDSVFDPGMRKLLTDSTDFISVEHDTCGEYHVEHITYLDYKVAENIAHLAKIPYPPARTSCDLTRDSIHITNPFPDMTGIYSQVYYYKGRLMFSGGMDDSQMDYVILDSSLYMFGMTDYCWPYLSAHRTDAGVTIYVFPGSQDYLEIKKLTGHSDLQLWKWTDEKKRSRYELRVLLEKSLSLPTYTYYNNLGIGACGSEVLNDPFDKINFDSLMTAK